MPVVIRMARHGAKSRPYFRVVVADSRFPKEGRSIEVIGSYDPTINPPAVKIDQERLLYWHGKGAQMSNIVSDLSKRLGIQTRKTATPKAASTTQPTAPKVAKPAVKAEAAVAKPAAAAKKAAPAKAAAAKPAAAKKAKAAPKAKAAKSEKSA